MESGPSEPASDPVTRTLEFIPPDPVALSTQSDAAGDVTRTEVAPPVVSGTGAREFTRQPTIAPAPAGTGGGDTGELKPGEVIGDCKVVSLLGVGGMGEVYLAQDTKLERRVAVKLLKRHPDDDTLLRLFRHERKVLAGLNHPNIARLYGGSVTPEGRSYLVMEYVEGERLDRYCDDHNLGVNDRLKIFRKVCAAVSYAHQNLVVHRDLKPANIRVTPEGEPKLLDFGIAKLLDPERTSAGDTMPTMAGAMTPEYASPEQLRGEAITTASDVYSLGVILYALLTGQRPYKINIRRPDEMAHAICEQEPLRLSTIVGRTATMDSARVCGELPGKLRRRLTGDLDNIVAMALRKEPERRYRSVAQFADDLRRHGEGLPVIARKDTLGYRTGKFVRRNKIAVAASLLVVLVLLAGLVGTAWEARRANRRFEDVRLLADSILFEVEPQIANLPGSTQARSTLIKRALEYLDSLSREAGRNLELRRDLAAAYEKVGDVQGNPNYSNLGDIKGALASYRKAQELRELLMAASPRDASTRDRLANNHEQTGGILWWSNQTDGALAEYHAALSLRRALLTEQPLSVPFRQGFASLQMSLGDVFAWNNQTAEALVDFRLALPVLQQLAAEFPQDTEKRVSVARCLARIGVALKDNADYAAAADTFAQAESIVEPIAVIDPNNYSARLEHWFIIYSECEALIDQKEIAKALALCPKVVSMIETLVQKDPKNAEIQHNLANSFSYYGQALIQARRWPEAIDQLQKATAIDAGLAEQSPENGEYAHSCGSYRLGIAQARLHLGQLTQAAADGQAAQKFFETAAAKDPSNIIPRRELVKVFTVQGEIREQEQQPEAARQWFQRALTQLETVVGGKKPLKDEMDDFTFLRGKLGAKADGAAVSH